MEIITWVILSLSIIILIVNVISLIYLAKSKKDDNNELFKALKNDLFSDFKREFEAQNNLYIQTMKMQSESLGELNKSFSTNIATQLSNFNDRQTSTNQELEQKLENIRKSLVEALEKLTQNNNQNLKEIRDLNEKKLEEMRLTVDEKLQSTLEKRISQSFKTVQDSLSQVNQQFGEMQELAKDVGSLKSVLSNVRTRGTLGEIQLAKILEEILRPEQYEVEFPTKRGSNNRVEFAVKIPTDDKPVYLPIDSKFPLDMYSKVLDAYETNDQVTIEKTKKDLRTTILSFAKDISSKYIDVPNTTEFAIMFLPIEGLYAEVLRLGLVEELQNKYKINIAGPTTMAALLNAINMGFKTQAIQARSSEVWDTLSAVKAEFSKFEKTLKAAQNRIKQADKEIETLVGTRTRLMKSKLKNVELLPEDRKRSIDFDEEDEEEGDSE